MNDQQPLQRSPRILVIDDQENIHEDYRKIIGRHRAGVDELDAAALSLFDRKPLDSETQDEGFDLDCAFQGEQGRQMVQQALDEGRPYAMAFVDIRMPPGWDGIETVRKIWEIDSEILIVICSAYSDYSWEQMVRELGRTDRFLILKKPFDVVEVRQFAMALTRRWSLARTDDLTGILNRRSLQEQLEREWAKSVRYATPLSCVMLDLDRFKQINDLEGHQAGDAVLKSVAAVIQQRCRASDLAFRYGGEEFCILLPNTTEAEAARWAERTRELIAATPATYESRSLHVTASMGVAERMLDTRCATVLVNLADEALRVAKQVGRNRVIRASAADSAFAPGELLPTSAGNPFRGVIAVNVMSPQVASLTRQTTVGEAARFFLQHGSHSAPVVDDEGKLVGVVSEKAVLGVVLAPEAWTRPIDRITQADVVSYDQNTPIERIFDFLSRVSMRQVIIVQDGRPVGTISRTSLLRWFSNWALAQRQAQSAGRGESEIETRLRLIESIQSLEARATQLANELASWDAGGRMEDDSQGPVIGSVVAMQDLLADIIALFSIQRGGQKTTREARGVQGANTLSGAGSPA
ncbi:MAG TPA: diguanylate cyclase [Pirellulales bacterium]|nr:diguanylate cyclase [Pirellulales bacterium]